MLLGVCDLGLGGSTEPPEPPLDPPQSYETSTIVTIFSPVAVYRIVRGNISMRHCLVTIVTNHLVLVVSGTFVVSWSKTGLDWTGLEKCGLDCKEMHTGQPKLVQVFKMFMSSLWCCLWNPGPPDSFVKVNVFLQLIWWLSIGLSTGSPSSHCKKESED